ncbi:VOC family protein [Paenibacillus arenilitoris]|uniref:VOC family protein n=1 Tax=Paenibacillus arenilitoris TaxID=2772299 RepID=A0A927H5D9_9BACL|nr:VOC family protein [Paenibacillus arenilitoris]MBD2867454.1 VOC family protein [Paenibacillus arenilitoris]
MKIRSVKLLTDKLERLKTFYSQVLGLPAIDEGERAFTVGAGSSQLIFEQASAAGASPYYHLAFDIPANKTEEALSWLQSRGIPLNRLSGGELVAQFEAWNAESVYFYDPAGNIVEFIARRNLNRVSHDPFAPGSLLNISEIGLAVHDVPQAKALLASRFAIGEYRDGSDDFAALGDEDGLLILSSHNRVWLGSDKAAYRFGTEVVIEGAGRKGEFEMDGYPYRIVSL